MLLTKRLEIAREAYFISPRYGETSNALQDMIGDVTTMTMVLRHFSPQPIGHRRQS
jgi:hypothetical protein